MWQLSGHWIGGDFISGRRNLSAEISFFTINAWQSAPVSSDSRWVLDSFAGELIVTAWLRLCSMWCWSHMRCFHYSAVCIPLTLFCGNKKGRTGARRSSL